jgi:hypothetical protein
MIYTLGWIEQPATSFCHATQNGMQFKTQELCLSRIFYFMFVGYG